MTSLFVFYCYSICWASDRHVRSCERHSLVKWFAVPWLLQLQCASAVCWRQAAFLHHASICESMSSL